MGGARSISQCVVLWSDGVLQRIAGWLRIPDESTVGRLFKEVSERHIGELKTLVHEVRKRVWARALRAGRSRIAIQCQQWVDADSSVKTVYGKQQGTAKGYNPHKRGAPSYHPLLAFCTDTKEILQAWLRTGSAYTSNGIVEFMKQLLAQLPDYHHIVFRADSGFFVGALMDLLDAGGHGYLIKAKLKGLAQLPARQHWTPVRHQPAPPTACHQQADGRFCSLLGNKREKQSLVAQQPDFSPQPWLKCCHRGGRNGCVTPDYPTLLVGFSARKGYLQDLGYS